MFPVFCSITLEIGPISLSIADFGELHLQNPCVECISLNGSGYERQNVSTLQKDPPANFLYKVGCLVLRMYIYIYTLYIYIVKIRVFEMHVLVVSFNIPNQSPLQFVVISAVVALTEPVVGGLRLCHFGCHLDLLATWCSKKSAGRYGDLVEFLVSSGKTTSG